VASPDAPARAIAGYPTDVRAIDLRTYAVRDEAKRAHPAPDPRSSFELVCVADLDAFVDRDALLRASNPAEPPYWALPWIGARAIAARVLEHPPYRTTAVLDLGCGLGLSGAAAGVAGAHVTFADNVAAALEFARANAELHCLGAYDLRQIDFTHDRLHRRFDWILAADVVYDPAHYESLAAFLDAHLSEAGTLLLTESLRADARIVLDALAARGMRATTEAIWVLEDGAPERTWLHALARAG
jgi:predicted nicotinamide N-methyase